MRTRHFSRIWWNLCCCTFFLLKFVTTICNDMELMSLIRPSDLTLLFQNCSFKIVNLGINIYLQSPTHISIILSVTNITEIIFRFGGHSSWWHKLPCFCKFTRYFINQNLRIYQITIKVYKLFQWLVFYLVNLLAADLAK